MRYDLDKNDNPTMLGVRRVDLEYAEHNIQGIAEFLLWAFREIGAVMGILASEAEAEAQRLAEWEAANDDEGL